MLTNMFNAKSIAVIGASETPGKVGYAIMKNLERYEGEIVAVNPKGDIPVLDRFVDLVIIAIPSKFVLNEMERIGKLGIKNVVIISAGFKEVGNVELENELISIVNKYDMNMVGPNVFGILDSFNKMNATFGDCPIETGNISLFSQSGAVIASINDMATKMGIGFSKMVSLGNKATLDESDLLEFFKDDPSTDVIIGYLEEIKDGPRFMKLAKEVSKIKPIVLIKAGRTSKGGAAAASHTGSIAGSDNAYETAFKQSGILRVNSVNDLLLYARVLTSQPIPLGNKIAIITNGGGAGIMATDDAVDAGFEIAELDPLTKKVLLHQLLDDASVKNPIDIIGAARPEHYRMATILADDDDNVDAIIILSCPQTVIPRDEIEGAIKTVKSDKPIVSSFDFEDEEVKALKALLDYSEIRYRFESKPEDIEVEYELEIKDVYGVESMDLLEAYDIPVAKSSIETNEYDAVNKANEIGYPVVMKVVSSEMSHKSDVGGIELNITEPREALGAFQRIMDIPGKIDGVQIQKMLSGKEIIIGMIRDPSFGPMLMVGLGGIYVEVLKDVQFGIGALSKFEAINMVKNLKTYKLLTGIRGEAAVDIDALVDVLMKVSKLAMDHPELKELEINPLMVSKDGAVAVDFRAMR